VNAALLVLVVPFVVCLIRLIPEASVEVGSDVGRTVVDGESDVGRETAVDKR
jgi:hypothetical protein